jgi:hypothetical protein
MSKLAEHINVSITISDDRWPLLTLIAQRSSLSGAPAVVKQERQYDVAYSEAEVMLHNQLRPAIDELIRRRKGAQGQ